jgi:hypothetical protein
MKMSDGSKRLAHEYSRYVHHHTRDEFRARKEDTSEPGTPEYEAFAEGVGDRMIEGIESHIGPNDVQALKDTFMYFGNAKFAPEPYDDDYDAYEALDMLRHLRDSILKDMSRQRGADDE